MCEFALPQYFKNPNGWGPTENIPSEFSSLPLQMFSKNEKIGKVADWYNVTYPDKRMLNKYQSQFAQSQFAGGGYDADDAEFQLVDTTKLPRPMFQRRPPYQRRNFRGGGGGQSFMMQDKSKPQQQQQRKKQQNRWGQQRRGGGGDRRRGPMKVRNASVSVKPDWLVIEEMDYPRLAKLTLPSVKELPDVHPPCGSLEFYNKRFEQVNPRAEIPLKRIPRNIPSVTTIHDPIIRQVSKTSARVFATDSIVATLMACTRSVYSWDIVATRIGNKLFLDKRATSSFDLLTVNETSPAPPDADDGINSVTQLAAEATALNQYFSQQVLRNGGERVKYANKNPFVDEPLDDKEMPSIAYRYRRFDIGGGIEMVVRTEQQGVAEAGANNQILSIYALNEWDSRLSTNVDWRSKLETQHGTVLATAIKNNNFRLAKWVIQSLLAGSQMIKLGYVSRKNFDDAQSHSIIGTTQMRPSELAQQMSMSIDNSWAILRVIVDLCLKQPPGVYLIMKDPNKQIIRMYSTPNEKFLFSDSDDDTDSDDEEEA